MMQKSGFSLIEISIVLVILSLLALFAYPKYTRFVVQAQRAQAAATLSRLAVAMEKYYLLHGSYQHASVKELGFANDGIYQLQIRLEDKDTYLLIAATSRDKECGNLLLRSTGERAITGNQKVDQCW